LIFDPTRPETLVASIIKLANFSQAERQSLGQNGRRFAESHLSLEKLGTTLLEIYQK
jgi:hypothetical protein